MENKKIKCSYPSCKKEGVYKQAFELINKKGSLVEMPFCEYHHLIVMGNHFKAEIIEESQSLIGEKKEKSFKLVGPLQEVEIAEQVMGARDMMIKLKNEDKDLKKK